MQPFKMQMAFPSWPISNFSSGTLICFHLPVYVFHLGCRELGVPFSTRVSCYLCAYVCVHSRLSVCCSSERATLLSSNVAASEANQPDC